MGIDAAAIFYHHLTLVDAAVMKLCKLYVDGLVFGWLMLYFLKNLIEIEIYDYRIF